MKHPVYLVDDDAAVRQALTLLLSTVDIAVSSFAEPQTFFARLPQLAPGCVILDIRMPVISGLKLQERMGEIAPDWPVIIMSGHGDIEACRRAFRNGALHFLSKPVEEQDLIDAIQKAQAILERQQGRKAELAETMALMALLTPREAEVLGQIAEALGLSPRTVDSHRAAIGTKLGTTSQAEMTRLWLESQPHP